MIYSVDKLFGNYFSYNSAEKNNKWITRSTVLTKRTSGEENYSAGEKTNN